MSNIVVSIIMPTYNRSASISLAIESVLRQSYQDWEFLIIDNESNDNTKEIVEKFLRVDNRIKYYNVKKSNKPGIAEYLNFGIEIAGGKYIARLDDDDEWWDPQKLEKQINFLENNNDYMLVGGGVIVVDGNRKEMYKFLKREKDQLIRNNALYANPFWHNTVLFIKQKAREVGGYKNIEFCEDWDLWLRLGMIGKFYNIQEYFSLYMNAGQNLSVSNQKQGAKIILKLISSYKDTYPNAKKALILNTFQLLFAYTPSFFRKKTQNLLFYIKRNYF